jgi:hypothetical protein
MSGYTKLTIPSDLQMEEEPIAQTAHAANHDGEMLWKTRVGDTPPAKVANLANPGGVGARGDQPESLLFPGVPCVVCGGVDRWEDAWVWRCRGCWPVSPQGSRGVRRPSKDTNSPLPDISLAPPGTVLHRPAPCRHQWRQTSRQATCEVCAFAVPVLPDPTTSTMVLTERR